MIAESVGQGNKIRVVCICIILFYIFKYAPTFASQLDSAKMIVHPLDGKAYYLLESKTKDLILLYFWAQSYEDLETVTSFKGILEAASSPDALWQARLFVDIGTLRDKFGAERYIKTTMDSVANLISIYSEDGREARRLAGAGESIEAFGIVYPAEGGNLTRGLRSLHSPMRNGYLIPADKKHLASSVMAALVADAVGFCDVGRAEKKIKAALEAAHHDPTVTEASCMFWARIGETDRSTWRLSTGREATCAASLPPERVSSEFLAVAAKLPWNKTPDPSASEAIEKLIKDHPEELFPQLLQGVYMMNSGNPEEALTFFEKAGHMPKIEPWFATDLLRMIKVEFYRKQSMALSELALIRQTLESRFSGYAAERIESMILGRYSQIWSAALQDLQEKIKAKARMERKTRRDIHELTGKNSLDLKTAEKLSRIFSSLTNSRKEIAPKNQKTAFLRKRTGPIRIRLLSSSFSVKVEVDDLQSEQAAMVTSAVKNAVPDFLHITAEQLNASGSALVICEDVFDKALGDAASKELGQSEIDPATAFQEMAWEVAISGSIHYRWSAKHKDLEMKINLSRPDGAFAEIAFAYPVTGKPFHDWQSMADKATKEILNSLDHYPAFASDFSRRLIRQK